MKKILIVCSVLLLLSLGSSQDPGMVLNYMVDVTQFYEQQLNTQLNFSVINGYLPVNWYFPQSNQTSLFFQFVTQQGHKFADLINNFNTINIPLIYWLDGGPGCPSDASFWTAHGPFLIDSPNPMRQNYHSWNKLAHVIYVDQPISTGYSYTDLNIVVSNTTEAAWHFLNFLYNFYNFNSTFNRFKMNPTYIWSFSYGGHYSYAFGAELLRNSSFDDINFIGVAAGDGWTAPFTQLPYYSDFSYQIGVSSLKQFRNYSAIEMESLQDYNEGNLIQMSYNFDYLSQVIQQDGKVDILNYELQQEPPAFYEQFLTTNKVSLGVPYFIPYGDCPYSIYRAFYADISTSFQPDLEFLLKQNKKVLIYQGQLDIIVSTPCAQALVNSINWQFNNNWKQQKKKIWQINSTTVGTTKNYDIFTYVMVYGAGHMVPRDQPAPAFDMLNKTLNWDW